MKSTEDEKLICKRGLRKFCEKITKKINSEIENMKQTFLTSEDADEKMKRKVDVTQGVENAGKVLTVGGTGRCVVRK